MYMTTSKSSSLQSHIYIIRFFRNKIENFVLARKIPNDFLMTSRLFGIENRNIDNKEQTNYQKYIIQSWNNFKNSQLLEHSFN